MNDEGNIIIRRITPGEWVKIDKYDFNKYCMNKDYIHVNNFDEKKDILFIEREDHSDKETSNGLYLVAGFVTGLICGSVALILINVIFKIM